MSLSLRISLLALPLLLLPAADAAALYPHTVTPGESLYSVAAADGLSVSQLAAANGISPDSGLVSGVTLLIPPQGEAVSTSTTSTAGETTSSSETASASTTSATGTGGYLVQPGDTLSAIAARAGTSVAALAVANGLDPNGLLLAGSTLQVSGSAPASTAESVDTSSPATVSSGGPYPTPERVDAGEIGTIASSEGVSPSLAAAIGWQESGFNNDLVSSTDARGVMQIEPYTWDWIQHSLSVGSPLSPNSAADNVRGGVRLLRSLWGSTGGDPALTAAAYYQGLGSVREHGLYSDTQAYVNSVLALRRQFGG